MWPPKVWDRTSDPVTGVPKDRIWLQNDSSQDLATLDIGFLVPYTALPSCLVEPLPSIWKTICGPFALPNNSDNYGGYVVGVVIDPSRLAVSGSQMQIHFAPSGDQPVTIAKAAVEQNGSSTPITFAGNAGIAAASIVISDPIPVTLPATAPVTIKFEIASGGLAYPATPPAGVQNFYKQGAGVGVLGITGYTLGTAGSLGIAQIDVALPSTPAP